LVPLKEELGCWGLAYEFLFDFVGLFKVIEIRYTD
jgi:hypothetical protein